MNKKSTNIIAQLAYEIGNMPELQIQLELISLNTSLYIFDQNFIELEKAISFLTNDPQSRKLTYARNIDKLKDIQIEIIRRLHNYVAAALSLLDHTRNVYNKLYKAENLFPEYQDRVSREFINDPLSQFVKGLRQYCQHYKAPNLGLKIEAIQDKGEQKVVRTVNIYSEDLRAFGNWNATAKRMFDNFTEDIDILKIARTYNEKVINFYEWFQSRQEKIHENELKRLREKQEQLKLVKLEMDLNSYLANPEDDFGKHEDHLFLGILMSSDFDELSKIDPKTSKRVNQAIRLLEKQIPISEEIKKKILDVYKLPSFIVPYNKLEE